MSALRIASLRLVWLEVFLDVADTENISATARNLGIDQSTVSRHLQALQRWLGKDLIVISKIIDPSDAGRNVALTEEGHKFDKIARDTVEALTSFRTTKACGDELLAGMRNSMRMLALDLSKKKPSEAASRNSDAIDRYCEKIDELSKLLDDFPNESSLNLIKSQVGSQKSFVMEYEKALREEKMQARPKPTPSPFRGTVPRTA